MNKKLIIAAAAALALPTAALAADNDTIVLAADKNFSYTYGQFGYTDRDFDGASADGFELEGSFEVTELLYVFGGYSDLSGDGDSSTLTFGGGAAIGLNDKVDGYAQFGLVQNEVENNQGSVDDSGFGLEFGVRAMMAENIEVFGDLQYVDIYEDSDTVFEVGGRYWLEENLGFSLAYTDGDFTGSGITLAARFNF